MHLKIYLDLFYGLYVYYTVKFYGQNFQAIT